MEPDSCGCCDGINQSTPRIIYNRPGLSEIAYRIGQHSDFKQSLLSQTATALPDLKTRDDDDFTIALLDAWSVIADILCFYQERIVNEHYLRTATERFSVLQLSKLIGYELQAGVSANAYLAFTTEDDIDEVTIAAGTQAQHIPAEGELPQKFETAQEILARPEWNSFRPRLTRRHPLTDGSDQLLTEFYFSGVSTNLVTNNRLLITSDNSSALRAVSIVNIEAEDQRTRVEVYNPISSDSGIFVEVVLVASVAMLSPVSQFFYDSKVNSNTMFTLGLTQGFSVGNVLSNLAATQPLPLGIKTFRAKAALFGHNAPSWETLPANLRQGEVVPTSTTGTTYVTGPYANSSNWVDNLSIVTSKPASGTSVSNERYIFLDNSYPVTAGSVVVLEDGANWLHAEVVEAKDLSVSEFTLSAKVTRLRIRYENSANLGNFSIRGTSVHIQSEDLALARLPIEEVVTGDEIILEGWIDGLQPGQDFIVCGELAGDLGNHACEQATIDEVEHDLSYDGGTIISLKAGMLNSYVRDTVTINANVALATHGESKTSELGYGNAAEIFQDFSLPHVPLTYVSSEDHPKGAEPVISVAVDGVRWGATDSLRESASRDRDCQLRIDNSGVTHVLFGDGIKGARLPTGSLITADYRFGTGRVGNVSSNTISMLARRPLGIRSVTNPIVASGGDDPETIENAKTNAPLTTLTLERIVSLQDYQDYANAFAGISKAFATWTWFGQQRGVYLTVAGAEGADVVDPVHSNLLSSIRQFADPTIPVRVAKGPSYQARYFSFSGSLEVDPDYDADNVLAEIEIKLREYYSFDHRSFGQDVTASELITVMHSIAGVIAIDIDTLYFTGEAEQMNTRLIAAIPKLGSRHVVSPAEILMLDLAPLSLEVSL